MVLGLFEGNKIGIILDKPFFRFGQEITGKVVLEMKQQKKANALRILLYYEYEVLGSVNYLRPHPSRKLAKQKVTVHHAAQQSLNLDGAKEFHPGRFEYAFKFICQPVAVAGFSKVRGWFLEASLDIPLSADVSKKMQVNIQ